MFNVDLIKIDKSNSLRTSGITKADYGQIFFQCKKNELIEHFGMENIKKYIKQYRRYEKRLKLRNSLNKKIPFLKNIHFSKILKK